MAGGFGVKIDLKINTKKSELRKEIQTAVTDVVAKTPIKIDNFKISLDNKSKSTLTSNIKEYLDKHSFKLKIEKIDASGAISNLRKQLETMLSGLQVTGLKDFVGDVGASAAVQKAADNLEQQNEKLQKTKQVSAEAEGQIKSVALAMGQLQSALRSAGTSGNFSDADGSAKLKALSATVAQLQTQFEQLKNTKLTATSEEFEKLRNAVLDTLASITSLSKASKDLPASVTAVSNLTKRISEYIRLNPRVLQEFPQLSNYLQTLNERASDLTKGEVSKISALFTDITIKAKSMGIEGRSAIDFLKEGFQKFGGWSLITKSMTAAMQIVKKMVTNVIELNSAMTELKKVTNETDSAYESFLKKASVTAKQIGATLTDTVTATADFARLGYSVDDAASLAEAALVYKNVGDDLSDINEASESLISTMQAFREEVGQADDAITIVDKFNEVSNNFSISSGGIGEALQRSAASLAAAGNDLNSSIALITAANTVVQNPETVGTTLKTVSMFLRAAKTEAEEAGESTEGMASSVSELREEILALTGNRVDIMIDSNNFKSTYQILKELSDVWGTLTDVSKANILEMTAGKRNSNVMSSLLENFSLAEDVLATSANASGSALEENEKYLESINGKIAIMKASFETASNTIVESGLVEFFVDVATELLNITNSLAEINVLLPSILTTVGTINGISMFSKGKKGAVNFFDGLQDQSTVKDMATAFKTLTSKQQGGVLELLKNSDFLDAIQDKSPSAADKARALADALLNTGDATASATENVADLTDTISEYLRKTDGFKADIKNVWSNMSGLGKAAIIAAAAVAAYKGLETLYNKVVYRSEDLYKKADEIRTKYEDVTDEIDKKTEEIQSNQGRILELKDKLSDGTITFIEESELSKIEAATKQLEYQLQLKEELQKADAEDYNEELTKSFEAKKYHLQDGGLDVLLLSYQNSILDLNDQIDAIYADNSLTLLEKTKQVEGLEEQISKYSAAMQELSRSGNGAGMGLDEYIDRISVRLAELDDLRRGSDGVLSARLTDEYEQLRRALKLAYVDISENYVEQFIGDGEGKDVFQAVLDRIQSILDPTGLIEQKITSLDGSIRTTLEDLGEEGLLTAEKIKELANSSNELSAILTLLGGEDSGAVKLADYFNALHIAGDAVAHSVHEAYKKLVLLKFQLDTMPNGGLGTPEYIEYLDLLHRTSEYSSDSLADSVTEVDPVYTASEKYYKVVDLISQAQDEMSSSGSITADTIKELSELTGNYTDYLIVENDAIRLNTDALMEYAGLDFSDKITDIKANIVALKAYQTALYDSYTPITNSDTLRNEIAETREKIALFESELALYEAIQNSFSEKKGIDGITSALGSTTSELEKAEDIIERIGSGDFDNLTGLDFTNLMSALPTVKAELLACVDAAEDGNLSFAQQQALYLKLKAAAKAFKQEKISDALEDVADAANTYGAGSFQAQNAIESMREYAPELVTALYDEEQGMYDLGSASEYSASALLAFARIKLTTSINTMVGDLDRLNASMASVGITAKAKAMAEMWAAEKEAEIATAKDQLETLEGMTIITAGGGGSSSTPADEIKETFDSLNASLEHSIYLQQQYYSNAEKNSDGTAMRNSLLKQIEFYKQIQEEAHKAADQLRAYYRSQGMSAETIEMQSDIQDLSKTWWEAANSIEEANSSIYDSVVQAFSDSVDEIQKVYDSLHEAADTYAESGYVTVDVLQEIVSMGVEYLAFLQDENGQLVINEENIQKIIAARTEQMAIETALSYVESLRAAQTAGNIEELNRLLYATQATSNATWGLVYANLGLLGLSSDQYNAALKNINSLRALANSAVQSIGKVAEKTSDTLKEMQDGVDGILKYVEDMIRHEVESQVDALEDLKDSYSELVELKKESLDASKNESEYTEQVAELTNKIAKIQSEIDLLDLVGTRESAAKKAALLEEQTELQKELSKLQGDYAYDAQIDALDKMEEAYHASKDDEIKALEDTISSEEKLYQLAIARIQSQWDTLYQQLIAWNTQNGSVINDEITSAWNSALAAAQRYGSFVSALKSLPTDIESAGASGSSLVVGNTFNDASYTNDEAIRSLIETMKANAVAWHSATKEQQDYLAQRNEAIAEQLRAFGLDIYKTSGGVWYLSDGRKLFDVYSYHTGGIVGGGTPKENEQFALLKNKEWVLNETMVDSLMKKLSFFERAGSTISKITDAVAMIYRPGVGNLVQNNPVAQYALADGGRSVTVSIGDTYINGADESTIRKHQQINKQFMDDLATQLGVRW